MLLARHGSIIGEPTELPGRGRGLTLRRDHFLLVIIGLELVSENSYLGK